jgi:PAS domain S-box-containing protein
MSEKEALIRDIKAGHKPVSLHYIQDGRGRALMSQVRALMARLDQRERASTVEELSKMNADRRLTLLAILGGGLLTCFLIGFGNYAIATSIAAPLVVLSKAVGSPSSGSVPTIPVFDRNDEIGGLSRVMQQMNVQTQKALDDLKKSDFSLRKLNYHLSASESKYRNLVNHAPIGIFMTKGSEIIFSNRYNQVLAGLDPDKVEDPATFRKRIHPEDADRVMEDFLKAVKENRPGEMIFRFVAPDEGTRTVLSRIVPIRDEETTKPVYIGFNVDITALHTLEAQLSRAEKLATLGQVATGIAHELRNPIVGIGSTSSLLLDEFAPTDPRRADIEMILQESKRMDRIVNQIVDYARPRGLAPNQFKFSDLINDTLRAMSGPLQGKHVRIKTTLSLTDDHLHADQDQIEQVLINVISNAIDASPTDGAVIEITAHEVSKQDKPGMLIRVLDPGKGIPPEVLSRIFEPFFTFGKRRGTGLGMAICKNIVEAHHGDIYVTSEVGIGTIVSIWLPLSQDAQSVTP